MACMHARLCRAGAGKPQGSGASGQQSKRGPLVLERDTNSLVDAWVQSEALRIHLRRLHLGWWRLCWCLCWWRLCWGSHAHAGAEAPAAADATGAPAPARGGGQLGCRGWTHGGRREWASGGGGGGAPRAHGAEHRGTAAPRQGRPHGRQASQQHDLSISLSYGGRQCKCECRIRVRDVRMCTWGVRRPVAAPVRLWASVPATTNNPVLCLGCRVAGEGEEVHACTQPSVRLLVPPAGKLREQAERVRVEPAAKWGGE